MGQDSSCMISIDNFCNGFLLDEATVYQTRKLTAIYQNFRFLSELPLEAKKSVSYQFVFVFFQSRCISICSVIPILILILILILIVIGVVEILSLYHVVPNRRSVRVVSIWFFDLILVLPPPTSTAPPSLNLGIHTS